MINLAHGDSQAKSWVYYLLRFVKVYVDDLFFKFILFTLQKKVLLHLVRHMDLRLDMGDNQGKAHGKISRWCNFRNGS